MTDQTWERSEILGSNKKGDKILIFNSHFGPSSRAPFAKLQIIKSGNSIPAFEDRRFAFQGSEATIIEFKRDLIKKNFQKIQEQGILLSSPNFANALSYETDNEIVIESDLYRDGGITTFHLNFLEVNDVKCPRGIRRPLSLAWMDRSPIQYQPIKVDDYISCNIKRYKFSRMALIMNTVWVFVFMPVEVMPNLYFFSQIVYGLQLN